MSEISQDQAGDGDQPRILLIDDSKVMRKSATKMLGKDFDLIVAEDGAEGWRMIQEDPTINVVFTDLNMPKMSGYEVLKAIRTYSDEGVRNLPVIVVTGAENDDEAKEQALEQGATDFITKPFNSTDLKARAQAHVNYQRTTETLQKSARIDPLTGLMNEYSFRDGLEKDLSFAVRHNSDIALMLVEVDGFNDLFLKIGRKGADNLVQQVAKVLLKNIRKEDSAGRVGLARYAISLPTASTEGASNIAQRVCQTVAGFKASLRGEALKISVSIGLYVPRDRSIARCEQILSNMEGCLNSAIEVGGNQVYQRVEDGSGEIFEGGAEVVSAAPISIDLLLQDLEESGPEAVTAELSAVVPVLASLIKAMGSEQQAQLRELLS